MFGSKKRGLLHMLANVLALDKEKQNAQQNTGEKTHSISTQTNRRFG